MKKLQLLFLALLILAMVSCKLDGENYSRYYEFVNIDETIMQDSATVGDTVGIFVRAGAPNGCWSDLVINYYPFNDTIYLINSVGFYESYDGICPEIYVTKDSTFKFIADSAGTFIFASQSRTKPAKFDTLVVVDQR